MRLGSEYATLRLNKIAMIKECNSFEMFAGSKNYVMVLAFMDAYCFH